MIYSNILKKYILNLSQVVDISIAKTLQEKFGIIFDVWSGQKMHFTDVIATYKKEDKYMEVLFTCAPLFQEKIWAFSSISSLSKLP